MKNKTKYSVEDEASKNEAFINRTLTGWQIVGEIIGSIALLATIVLFVAVGSVAFD